MPSLLESRPWLKDLDQDQLLEQIPNQALIATLNEAADYYCRNLPLHIVLRRYGTTNLDSSTREATVHCLLPSHGGTDLHPSARYFGYSRTEGREHEASVHCYKCEKRTTVLWFIYAMERDQGDKPISIRNLFSLIRQLYHVPYPTSVWLTYDPEKHFSFEADGKGADSLRKLITQATTLRELKLHNPAEVATAIDTWLRYGPIA